MKIKLNKYITFLQQILTVLTYRFKIQKHKHSISLMMDQKETVLFYWKTFLLWTGFQSLPVDEEPENVLPPVSVCMHVYLLKVRKVLLIFLGEYKIISVENKLVSVYTSGILSKWRQLKAY